MEIKLKPCPICCGEAEIISHYIKGTANRIHHFIRCKDCTSRQKNEYRKLNKAVETWNRQSEFLFYDLNGGNK